MSLFLEKQAFALPLNDPSAKLLLIAMCHLSATGEVYANPLTLQRMTGLAESTVRLKRRLLIKNNIIIKTDNNRYIINLKTPDSSEETSYSSKKTSYSSKKTPDSSGKTLDYDTPLYRNIKNIKNGELSTSFLESELKAMYYRKRQHPGNPEITNPVDRDNQLRQDFWSLVKQEKILRAEMDRRIMKLKNND